MPYADLEKRVLANKQWRLAHREELSKYMRTWNANNRDKVSKNKRLSIQRAKTRAFEVMGNKCNRCGITDWRVLQIDHVFADRRADKHLIGHNICHYYKKVIDPVNVGRYQLLCANCNWIKRVENKENGKPQIELLQ